MRIIDPSVTVPEIDGIQLLKSIEKYGRVCYKSEDKITDDSYIAFIRMIMGRGHESMLEHEKITVRIVCDRGVSHEIVRHRIAAYSQESTRYCDYSGDKFDGEVTFIRPFFYKEGSQEFSVWKMSMRQAENSYKALRGAGSPAQEARSVLPNSLKTEIVITYNLREWRHFFKLRAAESAHPQMRQIAVPLLLHFKERIPVLFDFIEYDRYFLNSNYVKIIVSEVI